MAFVIDGVNGGGVISLSSSFSEVGVATLPVSLSGRDVEGGMASLSVFPSKRGVAFVPVSYNKGGMALSVSVSMEEVWPLYLSVLLKVYIVLSQDEKTPQKSIKPICSKCADV